MEDSGSAKATSSSENDSEFAALLEAELEKDEWEEEQDGAGVKSHQYGGGDVENFDEIGEEAATESAPAGLGGVENNNVESTICPPHPGYMWNICIRCGKAKEEGDEEKGVALRYLHQGLSLSEGEAERLRKDDLRKLLARKKLYLVVDLDHTLLNSTRTIEVLEDTDYLRSTYHPTIIHLPERLLSTSQDDLLYQLPPLQMWTKLRPFVREFLEEAAGMFEMYVYTMGEKQYAQAMAKLLDPTGRLFGERVISQQDSTSRKTKDLDVVLGAESAVLIIDDTEAVWPKNRANLLVIERYHFFRSSRRQFGLPGESLVEAKKDESSEGGALQGILDTLKKVHTDFFGRQGEGADVRQVLASVRSSILSGCHVVFSRIFPQAFPDHASHPLWVRATELGAHCSLSVTPETTHVVALELGTEKARRARQEGKFVVRPEWLECCQLMWARAKEEDFPVLQDARSRGEMPEFARTVERRPAEPETSLNGIEDAHAEQSEAVQSEAATCMHADESAPQGGSESTAKDLTEERLTGGKGTQNHSLANGVKGLGLQNGLEDGQGKHPGKDADTDERASKRQKHSLPSD